MNGYHKKKTRWLHATLKSMSMSLAKNVIELLKQTNICIKQKVCISLVAKVIGDLAVFGDSLTRIYSVKTRRFNF